MIRCAPSARRTIVALALVLAGCQPAYDSIEIETLTVPPVEVTVRNFLIEMPAGVAVVARIAARSHNRYDFDDDEPPRLQSRDASVLRVLPRPAADEVVFAAVQEGETCVEVRIGGRVQECIDVVVDPPR